MTAALYRALLYLLPRDRRSRYGGQMGLTFEDVIAHSSGPAAKSVVWAAEIRGLMRFALREHAERLGAWIDRALPWIGRHRPRLGGEFRWAWRAFVARGWRAVMVVALLGVTLAGNGVVFATADSFLLHRIEYPNADRLVTIGKSSVFDGWSSYGSPETIPTWRSLADVFSAVYAHGRENSAYLTTGEAGPRSVAAACVEPGLLELLGARPVAGRLFVAGDHPNVINRPNGFRWFSPQISIIAESLAIEQFGGASQALGRRLMLGTYDTEVVGVIPSSFHFPTGAERIWTPMDVSLIPANTGVEMMEQLAPGVTFATAAAAVRARYESVQARRSAPFNSIKAEPVSLRRLGDMDDAKLSKVIWLLLGSAVCLLLITCANVVNLEFAAAISKARVSAIAMALGASPSSLVMTALIEGAIVTTLSVALGLTLAWQALRALAATLPPAVLTALLNPLDLDARVMEFMAVVAVVTWLVTTLPVAIVGRRTNVLDALRLESRASAGSRAGVLLRRVLTGAEVALSVALLIGAILAARSYSALLAIPKGFDVAGVVGLDVIQAPRLSETAQQLQARVLATLRATPFVRYAGAVTANPPGRGGAINGQLTIDGQLSPLGRVTASGYGVEPDYFQAMALPIVEGRAFTATDSLDAVVIDEAFARRAWPGRSALGAVLNFGSASLGRGGPKYRVVGVAGHLRNGEDTPAAISNSAFPLYYQLGDYAPLGFVVRLTDEARLDDLTSLVKTLTPTSRVKTELVRHRYARAYANEMLAASVMNIFGVLAFVVTIAGVYSVMTFLVAGRTREIGIRMALGADRRAITRMVVGSSARLVIAGALAGIVIAFIGARWGSTLLFGVSARDPLTYAGVGLLVIAIAIIATWRPAFVAGRIDPSRLLRD